MDGSRGVTHRVMACLVAVAFAFCMTGCERTVTKYDETGKPYSEKEFDPWMTIGGFILFGIILGGVIYAAEVNSSELLDEDKTLLAYAPSGNTASDALPLLSGKARWIEVLDPHGNLLSRHLIRTDRLNAGEQLLNMSEVQVSSDINEEVLRDVMGEFAASQGQEVPEAIQARVSFVGDGTGVMKISRLSSVGKEHRAGTTATRIITSPFGVFRVDTVGSVSGEIEVTVSQLN